MIIALAGRRVDAIDAQQERFSPSRESVKMVCKRIRDFLQTQGATALVSSAACGADLLGLSEAGDLGLRRRIVLPFDREKFRTTSVIDRPGDWGLLYDKVLNEVEGNGSLLIIQPSSEDEDKAYAKVNHIIVDEAISLGIELQQPVTTLLVWDGKSRGEGDLTEEFGAYARKRGIPVSDVMTL